LAISAACLALAIGFRVSLLGTDKGLGLSTSYFPALIVATVYAGPRWGWGVLAAALAGSIAFPSGFNPGSAPLLIMFTVSGMFTVAAASALRETLLRLQDVRAALDRSEARLQLAQDAGGVGLWDWSLPSGEGHWSPTLYKNLGLDVGVAPTMRSLLDVIHPDDRMAFRKANAAAIRNGHMEPSEFRVIWPDGQVRWLLSRGEMLRDADGRVVRAVGVNIDITDRRQAFERVRESEQRFRALADSAPVLLWVSRSDGRREFVNRAYVAYLGVSYEEAISFDWRERVHEEDLPSTLKEHVAGETSRMPFTLEARYLRVDGAWRWIRSISQPRYGLSGEFTGFIGIGVDITDAKQAEADLMRINDILAERIEAALAERDQAEAQLRRAQKLEAVGQLTGGVAHDFNNLLTVITGAMDLIQRHPDDVARRDRMIEAALGAAKRGERLTQQLLAFSRRQALKPEAMRIDDLLAESEPLLRRVVGEAVTFTLAPDAPGAVAMVDPSQFEAAIMNLVVNARDAVSQGGSIRIETCTCELAEGQVAEAPAGSYVQIAVHDTGIGMSPEVIARVFEPFFTTKEVGKGTGLGLSQVYGFARQSGGGVEIDSAPGAGASVRLYLPHSAAAVEPAAAETTPVDDAARRLKVLLVEDDAEVGDMVAAMLEELGHAVVRADSVEPALDCLAGDDELDLMLTDLVMPGVRNGVDLAQEAVALRPRLPIILSSGYTGETLEAVRGAPWPLLLKPYSAHDLARTIAQLSDRFRKDA
jgi:PAS domain S-box-containing protein